MKKFNKKNLKWRLRNHRQVRNIKKVRGKAVNVEKGSSAPSVQAAIGMKRLKKQNLVCSQNRNQDENMVAMAVLESLGVSVETGTPYNKSNYSLLEDQTDTELFENENIFDISQFKVISKATGLADKFPNMANPIFQPDDALTSSRKRLGTSLKNAKVTPNVAGIAGRVVAVNMSSTGTTSKQFSLGKK